MDHSHHGGGISTADGVPDNFYMQRMYWAVVGAAVVFATVVNVLNKILAWERYFTFLLHLEQSLT